MEHLCSLFWQFLTVWVGHEQMIGCWHFRCSLHVIRKSVYRFFDIQTWIFLISPSVCSPTNVNVRPRNSSTFPLEVVRGFPFPTFCSVLWLCPRWHLCLRVIFLGRPYATLLCIVSHSWFCWSHSDHMDWSWSHSSPMSLITDSRRVMLLVVCHIMPF